MEYKCRLVILFGIIKLYIWIFYFCLVINYNIYFVDGIDFFRGNFFFNFMVLFLIVGNKVNVIISYDVGIYKILVVV